MKDAIAFHGATVTITTAGGDLLQAEIPPGPFATAEYTAFLEPGDAVEWSGVRLSNALQRAGIVRPAHVTETGANPDFRPARSTDPEVLRLRAQMHALGQQVAVMRNVAAAKPPTKPQDPPAPQPESEKTTEESTEVQEVVADA